MPRLTDTQIDAIEQAAGYRLPTLYRKLLIEVGYGPLGADAEIYHPSAVYELYEPFFEDPEQLFHPYFPFGCHNRTQEIWVIDGAKEVAASLWHETLPDEWPEEEWLPYNRWIETYLKPELNQRPNILRMLYQRFNLLPTAVVTHAEQLSIEQIDALVEALPGFTSLADLEVWLSRHPPE